MRLLALLIAAATSVTTLAAEPIQEHTAIHLGPKAYRDGDVIRITNVTSTSPMLEQGDTVTVKGKVRLDSRAKANLALYLTQTEGDGKEGTNKTQTMIVEEGMADFSLTATIKHRGVLHLTFYDIETGRPFGGVYFGTKPQMVSISDLDVRYYLRD